jgi:hypothetical protein
MQGSVLLAVSYLLLAVSLVAIVLRTIGLARLRTLGGALQPHEEAQPLRRVVFREYEWWSCSKRGVLFAYTQEIIPARRMGAQPSLWWSPVASDYTRRSARTLLLSGLAGVVGLWSGQQW